MAKEGSLEEIGGGEARKKPRVSEAVEEKLELKENQVSKGEARVSSQAEMQRYLVAVEYIGTHFAGFQKQNECRTVQGCLEAAFNKFVGQSVSSSASSRTDTGVHALKNVCHVDVIRTSKRKPGEVLSPHDPEVVKRAVNHFLQKDAGDLVVVGVRCVAPDFHARFKAKERTYLYRIISVNGIASIFEKDRAWHVTENLNISAMRAACQVLVGHHDFSSFRAAGCQANSPMRTLDELHVCEVPLWPYLPSIGPNSFCEIKGSTSTIPIQDGKVTDEGWGSENENHHTRNVELGILINKKKDQSANRGSLLDGYTDKSSRCYVVTTRARSFLYHQVRLMVGTLKAVGSGSLTVRDVQEILDARSITKVPPMAPACGLYLADVKYDFDE